MPHSSNSAATFFVTFSAPNMFTLSFHPFILDTALLTVPSFFVP